MRAFVVCLIVSAALASVAESAVVRPQVKLVTTAPLLVRGAGFKAHEHVVVTVRSSNAARVADASASAAGAFTARFARALPSALHCGSVSIVAVGSLGDRVSWKSPPQVCGAQPGP